MIPKQLEKQVVEWYHNVLCQSGETRTELSISQNFYWKNLCKTVHEICTQCKASQFQQRNNTTETIPCNTLCVNLIG